MLDAFLDHGRWRLLGGEPLQEPFEFRVGALDLQHDAPRVVADPSAQALLAGQTIDEWTEADSLDRTPDLDSQSSDAAGRPRGRGCGTVSFVRQGSW
jgi:hypothetical protein